MEKKKHEDVVMHLPRSPHGLHTVSIEPKVDTQFDVDLTRRTWTSCCFQCDRSVVLYMTKTITTLSVLAFAMYRIASNTDPCKDLSFPTGLICTILGSYIEQGHQRMVKK